MTERWGYVVALPLSDYYDEEMWRRVFPPEEDEVSDFGLIVTPDDFDAETFRQQINDRIKRFPKDGLPPLVLHPTHVEFDDLRVAEFESPDDPVWLALKSLYDQRDDLLRQIAAAEREITMKRLEGSPFYSNGDVVKRWDGT